MTGSVPLMAVGTSPYNGGAETLGADPIRVLIADDEPALRVALADLLAHEDHLTLIGTAGDADEAIQIATDQRPDVALVDVKMPAGGGPRAAREITSLVAGHAGDRALGLRGPSHRVGDASSRGGRLPGERHGR